jgi:GNAT superfamily N-acetyltransferase
MGSSLSAPQPLSSEHQVAGFNCGEVLLDDWLRRRALANQMTGASRTFVICNQSSEVLAYYAMAAGGVSHQQSPGSIRRNMPDPLPVMVLARLAVDQRVQGRQIGGALLRDALQRSLTIAQNTGVRALLVHALNERARLFYAHYGFLPSPIDPMTLMLPLR